ncbi:MAG TPA: hypothetical protein VMW64_01000 [Dehalococcoidia bacterium]|nr:hypothetical protein [Dehalococcoidia bacterium]
MYIRVTLMEGNAQLRTELDFARAQEEMKRVLGFRGEVFSGHMQEQSCSLLIQTNDKWHISEEQKLGYLEEWINARVRSSYVVAKVEKEKRCQPARSKC